MNMRCEVSIEYLLWVRIRKEGLCEELFCYEWFRQSDALIYDSVVDVLDNRVYRLNTKTFKCKATFICLYLFLYLLLLFIYFTLWC